MVYRLFDRGELSGRQVPRVGYEHANRYAGDRVQYRIGDHEDGHAASGDVCGNIAEVADHQVDGQSYESDQGRLQQVDDEPLLGYRGRSSGSA